MSAEPLITSSASVSTGRKTTIPAEVSQVLDVEPGDCVEFVICGDGSVRLEKFGE